MESLYETDNFVLTFNCGKANDTTSSPSPPSCSFANNVIDPYHKKDDNNDASPLKNSKHYEQSYRERIAIMELACVDRQVEQYNFLSNEMEENDETEADVEAEAEADGGEEKEIEMAEEMVVVNNDHSHDTHNDKHNNNGMYTNDIHSQLYATDLEMDHRQETKQSENEVQSLMELYAVDQQVSQHTNRMGPFHNKHEYNIFQSLVQLDNQVNGTATATTTNDDGNEFTDPITGFFNSYTGKHQNKQNCWDVRDIMELLITDQFVDGCCISASTSTSNDDSNDIMSLYNTDCQVNDMVRAAEDKKEFQNVIDLYKMDEEMDALQHQHQHPQEGHTMNNEYYIESAIPLDQGVTNDSIEEEQKEKNIRETQNKNNNKKVNHKMTTHGNIRGLDTTIPKEIADLYCIDLEVEGRTCHIEENSDLDAVLDLYNTDLEVDRAKSAPYRNDPHNSAIFKDLYAMDVLIDNGKEQKNIDVDVNVEFVDHITSSLMRQYDMQSKALKNKTDIRDVFELHLTDLEVNGYSSYHEALADVEPLLKVDIEMNKASDYAHTNDTLKDVVELLKVDVEVDVMRVVQKTQNDMLNMMTTQDPKKDKDISKSSTNESEAQPPKKFDEMQAILDLHETDLQIARSHHAAATAFESRIFEDLWMLDTQVDGIPMDKNQKFVDPFTKSILLQYAHESKEKASRHDVEVCELIELIDTDIEVGVAASHKKAMLFDEQILSLHAVDQEVEEMKNYRQSSSRKKIEKDDDSLTMKNDSTNASSTSNTTTGKRRNIFSHKAKQATNIMPPQATKFESKDLSQDIPMNVSVALPSSPTANDVVVQNRNKRSIFSRQEKLAAANADVFKY